MHGWTQTLANMAQVAVIFFSNMKNTDLMETSRHCFSNIFWKGIALDHIQYHPRFWLGKMVATINSTQILKTI